MDVIDSQVTPETSRQGHAEVLEFTETSQHDTVEASNVAEIGKTTVPNSPTPPVIGTTSVLEYDLNYFMQHKKRGHAYIFHHVKYMPHLCLKKRKDAKSDLEAMKKILVGLGFDVKWFVDASREKVSKKIAKLSKMDHSDSDCVVIAVFTHGIRNKLYAYDGEYKPAVLWEHFLPSNCPSLAGKPKIIIIQACRGTRVDAGTYFNELADNSGVQTETDASVIRSVEGGFFPFSIPFHADLLIACSTLPGFYSFRNELKSVDYWSINLFGIFPLFVPRDFFQRLNWMRSRRVEAEASTNIDANKTQRLGSWFIQTLIQVLEEFSDKEDLLSMLTVTACRVATRFETYSDDDYLNLKKQIPCVQSTLTRKVFFHPKPPAPKANKTFKLL